MPRERTIHAQDSVASVEHHDEVRNRVEILDPLLLRSFNPGKEPRVFERHRRVSRECFEQMALTQRKSPISASEAEYSHQIAFASGQSSHRPVIRAQFRGKRLS